MAAFQFNDKGQASNFVLLYAPNKLSFGSAAPSENPLKHPKWC
jgi:hypothetical protein